MIDQDRDRASMYGVGGEHSSGDLRRRGQEMSVLFKAFNSGAMIQKHRRPGQEDGHQGPLDTGWRHPESAISYCSCLRVPENEDLPTPPPRRLGKTAAEGDGSSSSDTIPQEGHHQTAVRYTVRNGIF